MKRALFSLLFALGISSLAAGCSSPEPWRSRIDGDDWLLAVAALSDKVIAAGGQPGTAGQPGIGVAELLADDGSPAKLLASPQPGMLWWVHSLSDAAAAGNGVAWLCGENGSIVRYAEADSETLRAIPSATTATLYGIWAFSDDDVWAVGGDTGSPGVILHGGRGGLVVDSSAPTVPVLFKIFATDADHLFLVGEGGTILRRAGGVWTQDPSPVTDRLLTVAGTGASDVWAVGGLGEGRFLHFDGTSWSLDAAASGFEALAGLAVTSEQILITGQRGFIARRNRGDSAFTVADSGTTRDLHGALLRGRGRFAAGGNLSQFGLQPPHGVLLEQAF